MSASRILSTYVSSTRLGNNAWPAFATTAASPNYHNCHVSAAAHWNKCTGWFYTRWDRWYIQINARALTCTSYYVCPHSALIYTDHPLTRCDLYSSWCEPPDITTGIRSPWFDPHCTVAIVIYCTHWLFSSVCITQQHCTGSVIAPDPEFWLIRLRGWCWIVAITLLRLWLSSHYYKLSLGGYHRHHYNTNHHFIALHTWWVC